MPRFNHPSRRRFLASTAGLAGLTALGALPAGRARAADMTVGFIYVGPKDDFGYNQAHAEGAAAVAAMPGITVIEEENVAETVEVQQSMESMINFDGASLIFPTSFGYFDPHILEIAPKYPDVRFEHAGGLWAEGRYGLPVIRYTETYRAVAGSSNAPEVLRGLGYDVSRIKALRDDGVI